MSTTVTEAPTAVDVSVSRIMPDGAVFYGTSENALRFAQASGGWPESWCPVGDCLEDIGSPDCPHGALHQASPEQIVRRSPVNRAVTR